jgi:beta-ribofuranosylaminobenzene 5'-phosphate synthase
MNAQNDYAAKGCMSQTIVRVSAPSRLHFGMLSFGQSGARQFGGVGLMIAEPGIRLRITPADRIECSGPLTERAEVFARRVLETLRGTARREQWHWAGCRIEIDSAPREHIGLGTGTQLGLAIAAGISSLAGSPALSAAALARLAGRGERSSIGTHGFAVGGLLIEAGKYAAAERSELGADGTRSVPATLSSLVARIEIPADWRFLLLMPKTATGLFGKEERETFARIPPVPVAVTEALSREVLLNLLPAASEANFTEFSRSLYRYGRIAGECFASHQHGAFLNGRTAELVETIRALGGEGVGQSSWGPTLFVAMPDQAAGHDLAARLATAHDLSDYDKLVVRPNNTGAQANVERID